MRLERLRLEQFRNYEAAELEPKPALNWFFGPNGAGKSNLLEAILHLTGGRTQRARREQELVRAGEERARLEGCWRGRTPPAAVEFVVAARIEATGERRWRLNGQEEERARLRERFPAVLFTPDDLRIVKGAPGWRRRFLDEAGELLFPAYAGARRRFQQAAEQRNEALKDCRTSRSAWTLLEVWDAQYVQEAAELWRRREAVVRSLAPLVQEEYQQLAPDSFFRLAYYPNGEADVESAVAKLGMQLREGRRDEIARGHSLFGPQRDDLLLNLAQGDARFFGSQGEQRSVTLALKLGLVEALEAMPGGGGKRPILLLDDLFSELDRRRRQRLAKLLAGAGQAFVTGTEPPDEALRADLRRGTACFRVEAGTVREAE